VKREWPVLAWRGARARRHGRRARHAPLFSSKTKLTSAAPTAPTGKAGPWPLVISAASSSSPYRRSPPPRRSPAGAAATANDGATGDAGPCDPVAASATPPPWTPPKPFASGACAAADFDAFFDACLATPIDPAKCTAYKTTNAACATCLESEETDANLGPVIWHSSHAYFTLNLAGCIADAEKNVSATSCGAAYQAAIGCKQNACEACFTKGSSFAQFSACESAAGKTVCSDSNAALRTSCADALHDAGSPATACLPPATTTTRNAYKQIAPLFCGN
jgi:hypothetical protein